MGTKSDAKELPRHRCLIYAGSPADQLGSLARVIREKLRANYRCLYFNTAPMVAGLRSYLAAEDVDVADKVNRGILVLSSEQAHLADGVFLPGRMLSMLNDAVHRAVADGYRGLWASGDMTWELGPKRDFAKLIEYEFGLEEMFLKWPNLCGVCQYHADTLPTHVLQQGLVCHPTRFVSDTLSQLNPHYAQTPAATARNAASHDVADFVGDIIGQYE